MVPLEKSSRAVLKNCLDLKPKENLVIVADRSLAEVGETIWKEALKITKKSFLIKFLNNNGHKLPSPVENSVNHTDACLIISSKSIDETFFTKARHGGARVVILQKANSSLVERCFATNYKKLSNLSRKLSDLFSIGKSLNLHSPSGTEARITVSRVKGVAETGMAQKAGELTFLPAGEACVILNHKYIDGRITIDRLSGSRKKLETPITLNVKDGKITQIKGGNEAEDLRKAIRKFGHSGRQIYEFGVGTNHEVRLGNSAEEDEKALGTMHISFGRNKVTKVHGKMNHALKGLLLRPTLSIDGRLILQDGRIVI